MSKAASEVSAPKVTTPRIPKKLKELAAPIFEFLDARIAEKRTDAERRPFRYAHRLSDDKETIQVDVYFGPKVSAELDINSNATFRWKVIGGGEKIFRSYKSFLKTVFNLRMHGDTQVAGQKVTRVVAAANDDSAAIDQQLPEEKPQAKKKVTARAKAATPPNVTKTAAATNDQSVVKPAAQNETRPTPKTAPVGKPLSQPQLIPVQEAAKPITKRKVPAKKPVAAEKTTQRRSPSDRNPLQQNLPL